MKTDSVVRVVAEMRLLGEHLQDTQILSWAHTLQEALQAPMQAQPQAVDDYTLGEIGRAAFRASQELSSCEHDHHVAAALAVKAATSRLSEGEHEALEFIDRPGTYAALNLAGHCYFVPRIQAICAALRSRITQPGGKA